MARQGSKNPPVITSLGIIEGEVLKYLEQFGASTLNQLIRDLDWPGQLVTMAVGELVRIHIVCATEIGEDMWIKLVCHSSGQLISEPVPEVWGG